MKTYTALLKSNAEPVLVKEGFSWGALLFGPLWLAAHRAWVAAAISLAGYILIAVLVARPAATVLSVGMMLILGLTGNDLRRWALQTRGYLLLHVLAAGNRDDAFMSLLRQRPDLGARFRPDPV
ncbi:DUF2628 domain-containing protein [Rhodopila sp.]|uniref:DUF2628 domain-containing protein n=1 Tax=Rhodopila sp. TaxID=2480087 RepID=UPI003D146565